MWEIGFQKRVVLYKGKANLLEKINLWLKIIGEERKPKAKA